MDEGIENKSPESPVQQEISVEESGVQTLNTLVSGLDGIKQKAGVKGIQTFKKVLKI